MTEETITDIILGKSFLAIKRKVRGRTIKRKDCFAIISRGIGFDKDFSKIILKEMQARGLIESHNKGIRVKK